MLSGSISLLLSLVAFGATADGGVETSFYEGTVRCLVADGRESSEPTRRDEPGTGATYDLVTDSGDTVLFLPEDPMAAMLIDPRVRRRRLPVEGPVRGRAIELVSVSAISDGQLFHLQYRCDARNITANAPGPCWCCRQELKLRETPATADD